jgi:CSLREA domain-containing protein
MWDPAVPVSGRSGFTKSTAFSLTVSKNESNPACARFPYMEQRMEKPMRLKAAFLLLSLACLLAAFTGGLQAGMIPIVVTTAEDVIADDGECSLREAIINANNNDQSGSVDCRPGNLIGSDTIEFHHGLAGATIHLNGTALPTITESLTIIGPSEFDPDGLTIDAGGASRIFHAEGAILRLSFLTLTGGATVGMHEHGGAIFSNNASLALNYSRVLDSSTAGFQAWGGGIAVLSGNVSLNHAVVSGNSTGANFAQGGGLMVNGDLTLDDSTVANNHTAGISAPGGGVLAGGEIMVTRSTISGNSTSGTESHGGGLVVETAGLIVLSSTVSGNSVSGTDAEGGGVFVDGGGLLLIHSTVAFNRNFDGGVDGVVQISQSDQFGLINSLIVQDRDGATACGHAADFGQNSLATDTSCNGSATALEDINLLPLAVNSGLPLATQTHAFYSPSAALNSAGDCVAQFGADYEQDQRYEPRPGAGSTDCDIGAFELQGPIEARLQIVPEVLDLGPVALGETSATGIVEFISTGNTTLELMHVDFPPAASPFELTDIVCDQSPDTTLDPGERCTLEFSFTPDAAGPVSETLQVSANDPDSPHSYQLEGLGVAFADRIAFATSVSGSSDLGSWPDANGQTGLAAGDAICQARAQAAGLDHAASFVAWLSSEDDDAYCRLHGLSGKKADNCGQTEMPESAGPWLRTDGYPFAEDIGNMLFPELKVYTPLRIDEFGGLLDNPSRLFTATNGSGELHLPGPVSSTCGDWTDPDGQLQVSVGEISSTGSGWTSGNNILCDTPGRLICLERLPGPELSPFAESGQPVFATSVLGNGDLSSWPQAESGTTGLAAGDSICQNMAADAGLTEPENFKAWLSDDSIDAIDRIESNGPWVRIDGIPVAADKAELASESLFSAIAVTDQGDYLHNHSVWTGTANNGTAAAAHCSGWTTADLSIQGTFGQAQSAGLRWSQWAATITGDCNVSRRIYCLSDAVEPVTDLIFSDRFQD